MDYTKKYLKYKNKYITLRKSFIQRGGVNANNPFPLPNAPAEELSARDRLRQTMIRAGARSVLTYADINDVDDAINRAIYFLDNGQFPHNTPNIDQNNRNRLRLNALISIGMQNTRLEDLTQEQLHHIDNGINIGIHMRQQQQQQEQQREQEREQQVFV